MMTTVPAQPGFHLAILNKTPSRYKFHYYHIIAWIIDIETDKADQYYSSRVYPICFDWDSNHRDSQFIVRDPDGSIYFRDGPIFAKGQETEALAYAAAENEKRIARIVDLKG